MEAIGHKKWVIPSGHIPLKSNGKEPELLSKDQIAVLNTNDKEAEIKLTIFFNQQSPLTGYSVKIGPRRLRKIRINDLINPFPVYLEMDYSILIESDIKVIVQFLKMNTSHTNVSIMGTMGYGTDE
jgi:hypothetical protein